MKKVILLIFITCLGRCSFSQNTSISKSLYNAILTENRHAGAKKILVLDKYLDGANYSRYYRDNKNLSLLLTLTFKTLDSLGKKVPNVEISKFLANAKTYQAKEILNLENVIFINNQSEHYKNIMASDIDVNKDTSPEEFEALRQRRIKIINDETELDHKYIYQVSEPYIYSNKKNMLIILLIIEAGKNNFYVCNYKYSNARWVKSNNKILIYTEKN